MGREARAGRTSNMELMSVTLDVSKLSGWLNIDAPCRVTRGGMGGERRCEIREGVGGWWCKQRARCQGWG